MVRVSFRVWAKGKGAKRQHVIWWGGGGGGGHGSLKCTALDNVAESGGILNPPPPHFESFLFRASCVISGMHSVIWFLFHHTLVVY